MFERALATLFFVAYACGVSSAQRPFTIGSKTFTESRLLAEVVAQLVESTTEVEVARRTGLGGTIVCWDALRTGGIDLYVEYTGTAWSVLLGESDVVTDPLRAYLRVQQRCLDEHGVRVLDPLGFQNTYALAMSEQRAAELDITRISDLVAHDESLRVGFTHEFLERADGYPGLREAYGLDFESVRGLEHGLAYAAVREHELDLIDAYSTDGKLPRFGLRVLIDDRRYFPPYDAVPMVREAAFTEYPAIVAALAHLSFAIDASVMQRLNAEVEIDGRSFEAVAAEFVNRQLLDATSSDPDATADDGTIYLARGLRITDLLGYLWEHILLTAAAVALAALLAIPLGIVIATRPRARQLTIGIAGILQTIPSIALLAFLVPLLGLGGDAAITALLLYALLPILRNTCTGIAGVDPTLVDAARGLGMRNGEILRIVQLPLAIPTIMAGVRTATVISVGVATLAAFIGAGGLGTPIVTGLDLNDARLILAGALPAAALAILADLALGVLERKLEPRATAS